MGKDIRKAQKRKITIELKTHLDGKTMKLQGEKY